MSCSSATRHAGDSVSRCVTRTSFTRSPRLVLMRVEEVAELRRLRCSRSFFSASSSSAPRSRPPLRDRRERLAVELGEVAHDPLVDAVGQQQHLDALLAEDLEMRAVPRRVERVRGHVVDLVLPFLHAADVVGERDGLRRRCRRASTRSAAGPRCARGWRSPRPTPSFSTRPNSLPELRVLLLVVRRELFEQREHLARAAAADRLDVLRFLQDLARDVERQVVRVDDAAHEAQVRRQQLLGVVHDEHAPHVELDAVARVAVPQVERRARRDVEQVRELLPALDARVRPRERILEVVADVLVELLVLLVGDVRLAAAPTARTPG